MGAKDIKGHIVVCFLRNRNDFCQGLRLFGGWSRSSDNLLYGKIVVRKFTLLTLGFLLCILLSLLSLFPCLLLGFLLRVFLVKTKKFRKPRCGLVLKFRCDHRHHLLFLWNLNRWLGTELLPCLTDKLGILGKRFLAEVGIFFLRLVLESLEVLTEILILGLNRQC